MNRICLLLIVAVAVSGCNVYMTPDYQQTLREASDAIAALNVNCQAGDPNACSEGLRLADVTVKLFLEEASGI